MAGRENTSSGLTPMQQVKLQLYNDRLNGKQFRPDDIVYREWDECGNEHSIFSVCRPEDWNELSMYTKIGTVYEIETFK